MTAVRLISRRFVLDKHFKGLPQLSDFRLVEEPIPDSINQGEILCKAQFLSVDPYMRPYSASMKLGDTMIGSQVASVIQSKHQDFPVGTQVLGNFGWTDLHSNDTIYKAVCSGGNRIGLHFLMVHCPGVDKGPMSLYPLPDLNGLPHSYALGSIGLPGNAAYFGLLKICKPQKDETLVVSSAAGAVGSIVGQIGKLKGCRVLGFAGSDEKANWLKNDLGFDEAFNYKTVNLKDTFRDFAPKGIDCFFDNVGGEFTFNVMRNMNQFGRIAVCGAISVYNPSEGKPPTIPFDYYSMIYKNIRMEGFMVMRWTNEWFNGLNQLRDWILEGKIKINETVTNGFENMPQAFIQMLEGKNIGKAVIKA